LLFVGSPLGNVTLRRSVLTKHATGAALGDAKLVADQVDAHATTRGA
jgi:hypothetical protein